MERWGGGGAVGQPLATMEKSPLQTCRHSSNQIPFHKYYQRTAPFCAKFNWTVPPPKKKRHHFYARKQKVMLHTTQHWKYRCVCVCQMEGPSNGGLLFGFQVKPPHNSTLKKTRTNHAPKLGNCARDSMLPLLNILYQGHSQVRAGGLWRRYEGFIPCTPPPIGMEPDRGVLAWTIFLFKGPPVRWEGMYRAHLRYKLTPKFPPRNALFQLSSSNC